MEKGRGRVRGKGRENQFTEKYEYTKLDSRIG